MPIEIGKLEINAYIEESIDSERINSLDPLTYEEIIKEAVERVLEILKRRTEL